jgi:hypothetical protein
LAYTLRHKLCHAGPLEFFSRIVWIIAAGFFRPQHVTCCLRYAPKAFEFFMYRQREGTTLTQLSEGLFWIFAEVCCRWQRDECFVAAE